MDHIQQSTGRIITGLRHCCSGEITLFENDFLSLKERIQFSLAKYFNKLLSYGAQHRTADYLLNWSTEQRPKKTVCFHVQYP